jgi:pyruvate formate lyase activating enzyme
VRCFACKDVCPDDAILELEEVRIDHKRCSTCGKCASECINGALRIVGTWWDADSLLTEILKDKDFFMDSGGGITLSGGEPAIHVGFLKAFLPLVKNEGVHINMETCGMFQWDEVKDILPFLDLIYYDLKFIDSTLHKEYTGRDNRIIIENFGKLSKTFPNLEARMPVIPTINNNPENIKDTARVLKQNKKKSIHLLPYHNLGEAKLPRIKTDLKPLNLQNNPSDYLLEVNALFESEGIHALQYD